MMYAGPAEGPSATGKALFILAGIGVYLLCYAGLSTLFTLIPLPVSFLYAQFSGVPVLAPRLFLAGLAIFAGGTFVGWTLPRSAWLYGLLTGLCQQLPGVGSSTVTLSLVSIDLVRNPDIIYEGPGNPPLGIAQEWLIIVVMPVALAATLGALGGFCGRRLRQRKESRLRATD
jgi:hypothetical protein